MVNPQTESPCCPPSGSTPAGGCQSGLGTGIQEVALRARILYADSGSTEGLIRLEGGRFQMGCADPDGWKSDGEGPVREVEMKPFYLAPTTVTLAQFQEFVEATGYVTDSERFGWSYVFFGQLDEKKKAKGRQAVRGLQWWNGVEQASWKKPEGPGSKIKNRMDHPVTQVTWNDAMAYCEWAGYRLPTEAEWEFAARGGLEQKRYPWGDELKPEGKWRCNIWQGKFPEVNTEEDGYAWTAPAKSFKANPGGFYNCSGNVWEWCGDWFSPDWHVPARPDTRVNPQGPPEGQSKVMRGGSFLCHDSYCNRYRVGARTSNTPDTGTTNLGFRVARDA